MLKHLIIASVMTFLSVNAFADLTEIHEKIICNSEEARALIGDSGSCSVLISNDLIKDKKIACMGAISEEVTCLILFINEGPNGLSRVECSSTKSSTPLLKKTINSDFGYYKVSALITTSNNKKKIINDNSSYTFIQNELAMASVEEYKDEKEVKLRGSAAIILDGKRIIPLENVQCSHF